MIIRRLGTISGLLLLTGSAFGQDAEVAETVRQSAAAIAAQASEDESITYEFMVGNLWLLVAALLVFIMHLGFACLESGLTRARNTVNILFKNVSIVAIGTLMYALMGFNLMYPGDEFAGKLFGFAGFGIGASASDLTPEYGYPYTYYTDFIFQAMFAATAATIVSGAVAERIKLHSFLIFSTVFVGVVYPMVGMLQWGGGFLAEKGFHDFAGSTLVHAVGGWGALAGVLLLGPRLGKYAGGKGNAFQGHSMPIATIGVFLLWFGWFGFNGGSVLSASPSLVSFVFVTTMLAACAGVVGAVATSWAMFKKPDLSMALNGSLAGLVSITAGADVIDPSEAIVVGFLGGIIVVLGVLLLEKLRLDDPVGAIPVHLICGIWGTLAVGLFGEGKDLGAQFLGVALAAVYAFPAALLIFAVLKFTIGIRVSPQEERMGLDLGEHGMEAYSGFQIFNTQ